MLYRNKHKPNSKCNWVMDSLAKGWKGNEHHFWGFINGNEQKIKQLQKQNINWYYWDMPYWGRYPQEDFYWRASLNHVHYRRSKMVPGDRFEQWAVQPKPYSSGSKILVCPSSETMTRWTTGMDVAMWTQMITMGLRKHTDRPIEVRTKPRANGTSGPAAATVSFADQAQDTHCVVTCISLCAVEAQLLGIPTICHPSSFAAEVSSTQLEDIENPLRVNNQQWFYNLAYSQFTHSEIESGLAEECLNYLYTTQDAE